MAQPTIQQTLDLAIRRHQAGRLREAEQLYRQVLVQRPNHADALNLLGMLAGQTGRLDAAPNLIRRAIAICSTNVAYYNNLGNALTDAGSLDEAIAVYRQAIALGPQDAKAHYNMGVALERKRQLDEAIAAYRQAIRLQPDFAEAHNNLGNGLIDKGQLDEAIAACRQAIALKPDYAEAHKNLSVAMLARGDFQQGWEEYEWRWKCKGSLSPLGNLPQPRWDGRPLEDRTLLLYTEQGLGDALQFIRYVPLVARRGGRIVLECQAELQRLFQTIAGGCQIVARGQPLPAFDLHCPLLSLPWVFGTTLASVPKEVPYLHPDAKDAGKWQHRLAGHSPFVKVGLGWAGNPRNKTDRNRSITLARLAPLGQMPGVKAFSLQKGAAAAEAKTPPPGMELIDWTEELKDFADTAALIANLDLVIAVDTAVAHLAGAMGKPVWTLLPFVPDWRWLLERQDSPWYPSMRLFRQPSSGDWNGVIAQVAEALSLWVKNRP
jgi:Flp pilus assembly protein TadD